MTNRYPPGPKDWLFGFNLVQRIRKDFVAFYTDMARTYGDVVPLRLPGTQGYRVFIGPELQNFPSEDPVADTARFGSLLEAQIRDHPEQYLWIHRRFKGLSADYPNYYGRDSHRRKRQADTA